MDNLIQNIGCLLLAFYFLPLAASFIHRWLLVGYFIAALTVLIGLWGQHHYVTSDIDYKGSAGDGLGIAMFFYINIAFFMGGLSALATRFLIKSIWNDVKQATGIQK